ncbi:MAG: hypothetical protein EKK48_12375 [Candidatus Melainabacteria bacterium]|nr:MAG: hypothetical protein EKK48_12375 [Candidatus Melainabacteria bacterium]
MTLKKGLESYSIVLLPQVDEAEQHEKEIRAKFLDLGNRAYPIIACRQNVAHPRQQKAQIFALAKPGKTNISAILVVQPDTTSMLNPAGFGDYGPIPPTSELTLSDCEQLWGSKEARRSETASKVDKTFDLVLTGQHPLHFHIDTTFQNGLLKRYRVRCDESVPVLSLSWRPA